MTNNGVFDAKQMMVVISMEEEWSTLKYLLQHGSSGDLVIISSLGPTQICDMTVDGHLISLRYAVLQETMTEEAISQSIGGCFQSCTDGIITFLLLIQGGYYTKKERRMIEVLQAHFGVKALKYLAILSLDGEKVVDMLDDALLELINRCDGRYCRIVKSSAISEEICALLEMVNYMLTENGVGGYTETMQTEATRRSIEDTAMRMLKQKVQEAEEKQQAFNQLVQQQEGRRAREMEELNLKHAQERRKEAEEKRQDETKRESLEEAVRSHGAILQLQMNSANDDGMEKISVILLGLSGSGKSSAGTVILERAGHQYTTSNPHHQAPKHTWSCERKEVSAAGRRLIVVDTPELWDEDGSENLELVKDSLALAHPGPQVFLLVLQVGRFTQGESEMLGRLQRIFGREIIEHTVILFTRFDDSQQSVNQYVSRAPASLQGLIRKCGSRFYELHITGPHNALSYPEVNNLLSGVDKLVASHGGRCYSTKRFSVTELQERKKEMEERETGELEADYLLYVP
ncbi:GTPase IMAP family member 8-like [Genypterus blacodes]|uniref:GTPase IMAP family member 8-like n=1 Tax=Genypterus blacodes TaxID=154954 RepID=UPI003F758457